MTGLVACPPASAGWRDLQRSEPPPPVVRPVAEAPLEPPAALAADVPVDVPADAAEDEAVIAAEQEAEEEGVIAAAAEAPTDAVSAGTTGAAATDSPLPDPPEHCAEEAQDCREALKKLRTDSLDGIDLDIRVPGRAGSDYPYECRLEGETFEPRRFATTTFTWKAAGYCHKPLYFEHWNLERYGHSHGFVADSFLSAAHFFARIPALPYQMGVELPWECVYPLGYYRPGSCAPWTVPAVPVSPRGLAVGAAAATGIVFLLP